MRKLSYLLTLAVLGLGVFSFPSATQAATYTVTKTADTADGTCDADCSLREAVIAANANPGDDIISVPAGTYTITLNTTGEQFAASGDLDITDTSGTTTIQGAGMASTIIDGNAIERIFDVTVGSVDLTVNDLTVQNGSTNGGAGGGIYVYPGSDLTLDHVTVADNVITGTNSESPSNGAGLFFGGNTLTITDSVFSGNSDGNNGADYVNGGGISVSSGSGSSVIIERTAFINNSANIGAGILMNTNSGGAVRTLNEITVSGNTATTQGGGIYFSGGTGYSSIELTNALISGNSASTGGGMYALAPVNITNVSVYDNTATSNGGGLYAQNQTYVDVGLAHSTFTHNTSGASGGGLYVGGSNADVVMNNSIVAANTAITSGDDCYVPTSGFNPGTYNIMGDTGGCGAAWPGETNILNPSGMSYLATAEPTDMGGNVDVLPIWGDGVTNVIPAASCLDAADDSLATDARGYPRPDTDTCNMGAYQPDVTDPVVTVSGSASVTTECSEAYTDAGASANDDFAVNGNVSVDNQVNVNIPFAYHVNYSATDYDGNIGIAARTVTVQDTVAPTITLNGSDEIELEVGEDYSDAGATVTDSCDSEATLETSVSLDTSQPGENVVTYVAEDASGNIAIATRSITVLSVANPTIVSAVFQEGGTTLVTLSDDTTYTINPFRGTQEYRIAITSDNKAVVVSNGKYIKVFVDGEKVSSKRINKYRKKWKHYRLELVDMHPNDNELDTVAVLSTSRSNSKLTTYRLNINYDLVRKQVNEYSYTNRQRLRLILKPRLNRIITKVGSMDVEEVIIWKHKQNGDVEWTSY